MIDGSDASFQQSAHSLDTAVLKNTVDAREPRERQTNLREDSAADKYRETLMNPRQRLWISTPRGTSPVCRSQLCVTCARKVMDLMI